MKIDPIGNFHLEKFKLELQKKENLIVKKSEKTTKNNKNSKNP